MVVMTCRFDSNSLKKEKNLVKNFFARMLDFVPFFSIDRIAWRTSRNKHNDKIVTR